MDAADRLGVMDLIVSYSHAIDSGDLDTYVGSFTPDGVLDGIGGLAVGHAEIRKRGELLTENRRVADTARLRHFVGLPLIAGEGNRCRAVTYIAWLDYDEEGRVGPFLVGHYEDDCVKVDGRWLFERRLIYGDIGLPRPLQAVLDIHKP
jgi:hypothetical protein